jgi:hypothetical protein
MCKSAYKISKLIRIVVNLFSLCSHFGNNQEDAAYKNIERTHPFFKLSTWIIIISSCIAVVSMFLLVYPLAATPLFPHVSLFRRKACLSVHHRDFPLVDAVVVVDACTLFTTPIVVSARTCQQWQVPLWSWILRTRRVVSRKATYELHGVAANG